MPRVDVPGGVLVVRHSESTFHVQGRWAGWLDPPLTAKGFAEVDAAARRWRRWGVQAVTSSDLRRAAAGADRFARLLEVPRLPALPGLRERNAGAWQGQLVADLTGDAMYAQWRDDETVTPPQGERYDEFTQRLLDSVRFLLEHDGRTLAVTHDGVLSALCRHFGLPRPPMRPLVDAVKVTRSRTGRLSAALEGAGGTW